MDQDLNELTLFFEGKTPSVSMFKRKLVLEPYEIQHAYLDHFFDLALHTWDIVRPVVQNFYECLVKSFRQEFLDYLSTRTVVSRLRYPPQDLEGLKLVINLVEQPGWYRYHTNYTWLAFSLMMGFNIRMKVKSLSDSIRYATPEAGDIIDLVQHRNICFGRSVF